MIDVSVRLRRAILLDDLLLVRRIVRNNPDSLQNPDFGNKSNTSLHLAAKEGFTDVAAFLIEAGHESDGISRNTDHETPLMLAAATGHVEVAKLLISRFPRAVSYTNARGMDALMIAAHHGNHALLPFLLQHPFGCSPNAHDNNGDTALHHASAAGELKCLRILLQAGASPKQQNAYAWTPLAYSRTQAAKLYFEDLIAELERRKEDEQRERREETARLLRNKGLPSGGVRLVTAADDPASTASSNSTTPTASAPARPAPLALTTTPINSSGSAATAGLSTPKSTGALSSLPLKDIQEEDYDLAQDLDDLPLPPPLPLLGRSQTADWTPTPSFGFGGGGGGEGGRRPMTPRGTSSAGEGRREWGFGGGGGGMYGRARAHSGD